jgi:hypothetical protein
LDGLHHTFHLAFIHGKHDLESILLLLEVRSLGYSQLLLHTLGVRLEVGVFKATPHLIHVRLVLCPKLLVSVVLVSHHLRCDLDLIDGDLMLVGTVGAWSALLATRVVREKG